MATRVILTATDLLNCLICYRQFDTNSRKPKVLFCGHTVCAECTTHLTNSNTFGMVGQECLRCPTCRAFNSHAVNQKYATNFQILGALEEKEKMDREKAARGEKGEKELDDKLHFSMPRSKGLKIHVATKKSLNSPEMFIRKDASGETSMVIAGKTGSTEEIVNYINEHGVAIETGAVKKILVHEGKSTGKLSGTESFAKITNIPDGQSALKLTAPPTKLEEADFTTSYELKAVEQKGCIVLELVRIGNPQDGREVFGGSMAKPSAKSAKRQQPTTSSSVSVAPEAPVAKRTRRGRAT